MEASLQATRQMTARSSIERLLAPPLVEWHKNTSLAQILSASEMADKKGWLECRKGDSAMKLQARVMAVVHAELHPDKTGEMLAKRLVRWAPGREAEAARKRAQSGQLDQERQRPHGHAFTVAVLGEWMADVGPVPQRGGRMQVRMQGRRGQARALLPLLPGGGVAEAGPERHPPGEGRADTIPAG